MEIIEQGVVFVFKLGLISQILLYLVIVVDLRMFWLMRFVQ